MSEHTPLPWEFERKEAYHGFHCDDSDTPRWFLEFYPGGNRELESFVAGSTKEEAKANANLIAQAPTLQAENTRLSERVKELEGNQIPGKCYDCVFWDEKDCCSKSVYNHGYCHRFEKQTR